MKFKDYFKESKEELNKLKSLIAQVAQKEYEKWTPEEEGGEEEWGGGRICHIIAESIVGVLDNMGIEAMSMQAAVGENHTFVIAKMQDGIYNIDVPPDVYEIGSGYNWTKKLGVVISSQDVIIDLITRDLNRWEEYSDDMNESVGQEVIYRALPFNTDDTFRVNDYVTKSEKFALEHAETSSLFNGEDYKVIRGLVPSGAIKPASNPGEFLMTQDIQGKPLWKLVIDDATQMVSKEKVRSLFEAEFDFGDEANKDSIANVAAEVDPKYNKIPTINEKNKQKWKEARGFIKLSGAMERIGDMAHEAFAQDLGYPVMIDGALVPKKFSNSKFMCIATGLVRWSPETSAFSVYRTMTPEQIKTIKDIIKSYGYNNLWVEYMNKEGQMDMVAFDEGDPSLFNAKIAGIQHRVNDKKLGQR